MELFPSIACELVRRTKWIRRMKKNRRKDMARKEKKIGKKEIISMNKLQIFLN